MRRVTLTKDTTAVTALEIDMFHHSKHPCFNPEAAKQYARVHLPVAPECNIQCRYCCRKFDCVNESRPGVTSAVLTPESALKYLEEALVLAPNVSVVGIAGPGDPFADPERTLKTLELIHARHPELIFCLSSNGLQLADYVQKLKAVNVTHVTVTINTLDPAVGAKIYAWVRRGNHLFRGETGAELLIKEQLRSVAALKEAGLTVKINTILIPGVNDDKLESLVIKMKELGADIINCVPLLLAPGSEYAAENRAVPDHDMLEHARGIIGKHLPVMAHCRRCRADAAGLLGQDNAAIMDKLSEAAGNPGGDADCQSDGHADKISRLPCAT